MITPHTRAAPLALAALLCAAPLAAQPTVRLPAADRPIAGRATPVFTIGAEEGQSWEMLSTVTEVAFDRSDNLYVLDRGNERVLVFDRGGRFVRQLGKEGDGPGEFRLPIGMAVLSSGAVAVLDLAHRNVSLFGPDGAFQRTSPWPENSGPPSLAGVRAHPAGGIVAVLRPRMDFENIRSGVIAQTQVFSRLPLTAGGEVTRLFEIADAPVNVNNSGSANERRTMIRSTAPQFGPLTVWGVLPDGGTALSHTSLYTVKIQDAGGKTVRFLQRPVAVRRPTEADKQAARERTRENLKSGRGMIRLSVGGPGGGGGGREPRGGMSDQQIERQLAEMQFADTVRVIQGLTVAPTGMIWIERTPRDIGEPGPIDVVTAAGEYRGTITGFRLPRAISASGRAAYIQTDDSGVERVVVHQLPRNWLN